MLLTLLLVSRWHCFVFQYSLLQEARNREKTEIQLPLVLFFLLLPYHVSLPIWEVKEMLILCFEEQLSAYVTKRLKKFIYLSPPVFLQGWPLQSPPLLEVVQLSYISSYTSITLFTPLLSKIQHSLEKCSFLPQLKWFKGSFPILYFSFCLTTPLWLGRIRAYSLSKMLFKTFQDQESTQISEVIGWSDLILAHDSLRVNPFPLVRTFPCRSLAFLVLHEFVDD